MACLPRPVLAFACGLFYLFVAPLRLVHVCTFTLFVQVACGEQHNLARVLPSPSTHENKKQSSISSVNSLDQQAELFVWGGGRLGQVSVTKTRQTRNDHRETLIFRLVYKFLQVFTCLAAI